MPVFLEDHPGLLFVAATLLPLLSFVLILLAFALKTSVRKCSEGSAGAAIFQMMGGPAPGRAAAYMATGAIGLAFVLSLTGFVLYASGHDAHHAGHSLEKSERVIEDLKKKLAGKGTNAEEAKKLKEELQNAEEKQE